MARWAPCGHNFLHQWLSNSIPEISEIEALEIRENEIEEYTGSVFEVIHDVMQHREGGFG